MTERNIPFGKPILGDEEKELVWEVMQSGVLAHGPYIEKFEKALADFTGAPYVVGVSSCTAALHMIYFHMGLGAGDEVLAPAQTHTATAHAIELTGAKPVFVDAEPKSGNLDLNKVAEKITPQTKAISIVHYLGCPVDMNSLRQIADSHQLPIVEDCALSLGSKYQGKHTGLLGLAGCFSFYPVKHITTAEGGVMITRDKSLADSIRRIRAFGMDKHVGQRSVPGMYDVQGLGFNYRMNELQAAIGTVQMKRLPSFLEKRAKNFSELDSALSHLEGVEVISPKSENSVNSHYCLIVLLAENLAAKRPDILTALKQRGVGCSVYYPHPVPLMTYYRNKYGYSDGDFPVAEAISRRCVALPVGPHLKEGDVEYISTSLEQVLSTLR